MRAGLCDLFIDQGAAFSEVVVWRDSNGDLVDLTGYTGKCHARENKADSSPKLSVTLAFGGAAGTITMTVAATITRALTFTRGFWSLEVSPSGAADLDTATDNIELLAGKVTVIREATK